MNGADAEAKLFVVVERPPVGVYPVGDVGGDMQVGPLQEGADDGLDGVAVGEGSAPVELQVGAEVVLTKDGGGRSAAEESWKVGFPGALGDEVNCTPVLEYSVEGFGKGVGPDRVVGIAREEGAFDGIEEGGTGMGGVVHVDGAGAGAIKDGRGDEVEGHLLKEGTRFLVVLNGKLVNHLCPLRCPP